MRTSRCPAAAGFRLGGLFFQETRAASYRRRATKTSFAGVW